MTGQTADLYTFGAPGCVGAGGNPVAHCEMPMIMKVRFLSVLLVLDCCTLAGCHTTHPPVGREALIGSYSYMSEDPESRATDHNLSQLTLRSDGTYDLVEGGTTKAVLEKKGFWRMGLEGPRMLSKSSSITRAIRLRSRIMKSVLRIYLAAAVDFTPRVRTA